MSHALMSSLKDDADCGSWQPLKSESASIQGCRAQNKYDMSATPDTSQVEMWPYVASAAVASASHAVTAVRMVVSSATKMGTFDGAIVGAEDGREVGTAVVGMDDGTGLGSEDGTAEGP